MPKTIASKWCSSPSLEAPESAPVPFQVLADRLKQMRSSGGEAVGLGENARYGVCRRHTLLTVPALGDVFGCDQDDDLFVGLPYGLRIFANPEQRAVLADFSGLPAA
jgi:hypothetical protein